MALVTLPGGFATAIGPGFNITHFGPFRSSTTMDATNEAILFIGNIVTSDGASHTINTTGSSSLGWRTGNATFVDAGTTVKAGLAAVLTTAGPPARADHVANVITFDVSKSLVGGGGGITANSWQTHVPDTGSKTIANGDMVAFCVQMTARGGTDSVQADFAPISVDQQRPLVTNFTSGSYALGNGVPNCMITFADGAFGFFYTCEVFSAFATQTYNSGSAQTEFGQLYKLPFPVKIYGIYGWVGVSSSSGDFDVVLYSDPLGTPVAERTSSVDANTVAATTGRRFTVTFASPYTTTTNQIIVVAFKPGATNISAYYKTLASATHRIADQWGTEGYGVSRTSGAFANTNSSLDHYYAGLFVGAFDAGGGGAGRVVQISSDSLVA